VSEPVKKPRRYKKPRLSGQIEHADLAALEAVAAMVRERMPALGEHVMSVTMRGALRIGLAVLMREPEQVLLVRTPEVGQ